MSLWVAKIFTKVSYLCFLDYIVFIIKLISFSYRVVGGVPTEKQIQSHLTTCLKLCKATLDCEHVCEGTCGECFNGRVHRACDEKCGRSLVCGHICNVNCGISCPPCGLKCQYSCSHSKCGHKCCEPCTPCKVTWFISAGIYLFFWWHFSSYCRRSVHGAANTKLVRKNAAILVIVRGVMSRARKHYRVATPVRDCAVKYVHPCAAFATRINWPNSLCWEMKTRKTPSKFN
jgi:hypothetical protein